MPLEAGAQPLLYKDAELFRKQVRGIGFAAVGIAPHKAVHRCLTGSLPSKTRACGACASCRWTCALADQVLRSRVWRAKDAASAKELSGRVATLAAAEGVCLRPPLCESAD